MKTKKLLSFLTLMVYSSIAWAQTAPSTPVITGITGNSALSISFTAGNDGGSTITNYMYSTDGGATFFARNPESVASPILITTLSNNGTTPLTSGASYDVQIKAVNAIGTSDASATSSATYVLLGGGDGTQSNPYKISASTDWAALKAKVIASTPANWPYCELTNDVDLTALPNYNFMIQNSFHGVLDGKGHKMINLKVGNITTPLANNLPSLFFNLNSATIKNVELSVDFYAGVTSNPGYTFSGGIAAAVDGNSNILNCKVTGSINITNSGAASKVNGVRVGGIVGAANATAILNIINCVTNLNLKSISTTTSTNTSFYGTPSCGGILGDNASGATIYIINCNAAGSVYAMSNFNAPLVGGLLGERAASSTTDCFIYNCLATNTVEGYNNSTSSTLGCFTGGIVGNMSSNAGNQQIKNCIAMNPSIKSFVSNSTVNPTVNRISTKLSNSVLANNYAKSDMQLIAYTGSADGTILTGSPITITPANDPYDINGADLDPNTETQAYSLLNAYVTANPIYNGLTLNLWSKTTGINSLNSEKQLNFIVNNGELKISGISGSKLLSIYSITGKILVSDSYSTSLPKGVYILKVVGFASGKIVVY